MLTVHNNKKEITVFESICYIGNEKKILYWNILLLFDRMYKMEDEFSVINASKVLM